eukprot:GILK01000815.1.p1 GENE.GILK01000815.1~~GILK01000815.1.p1  ORF type:complete len:459 (+),score=77.92 GILK01000815.1:136-1512(+)
MHPDYASPYGQSQGYPQQETAAEPWKSRPLPSLLNLSQFSIPFPNTSAYLDMPTGSFNMPHLPQMPPMPHGPHGPHSVVDDQPEYNDDDDSPSRNSPSGTQLSDESVSSGSGSSSAKHAVEQQAPKPAPPAKKRTGERGADKTTGFIEAALHLYDFLDVNEVKIATAGGLQRLKGFHGVSKALNLGPHGYKRVKTWFRRRAAGQELRLPRGRKSWPKKQVETKQQTAEMPLPSSVSRSISVSGAVPPVAIKSQLLSAPYMNHQQPPAILPLPHQLSGQLSGAIPPSSILYNNATAANNSMKRSLSDSASMYHPGSFVPTPAPKRLHTVHPTSASSSLPEQAFPFSFPTTMALPSLNSLTHKNLNLPPPSSAVETLQRISANSLPAFVDIGEMDNNFSTMSQCLPPPNHYVNLPLPPTENFNGRASSLSKKALSGLNLRSGIPSFDSTASMNFINFGES